jgi:hypothetical protein
MIKLKDILLEGKPPSIFVPRRIEDRIERMIMLYVKNGSKGDLNLHGLHLTLLPDILKNISVGGNFWCGNNNLTSLQGAPKTIGRDFYCDNNLLTTLAGAPKSVGGDFYCSHNLLTSLEGAPETVGENFYCYNNPVEFTEEQVRAVCDVKGDVYV